MATAIKRKTKYRARSNGTTVKLPHSVAQQLEQIYAQSRKSVKKHPYKATGGVLLTLGLASGTYFLIRYMINR